MKKQKVFILAIFLVLIVVLGVIVVNKTNDDNFGSLSVFTNDDIDYYSSGVDLTWEDWNENEGVLKVPFESKKTCNYNSFGKSVCNQLLIGVTSSKDQKKVKLSKEEFNELLNLIKSYDARIIQVIPVYHNMFIEMKDDVLLPELHDKIDNMPKLHAGYNDLSYGFELE